MVKNTVKPTLIGIRNCVQDVGLETKGEGLHSLTSESFLACISNKYTIGKFMRSSAVFYFVYCSDIKNLGIVIQFIRTTS